MPLAAIVQVRISSEAAGAVALTPVVLRDMPLAEFIELLAAASSADPARIHGLLKRGVLVSGASRFRWQPLDCSLDDVAAALDLLPKPDPALPFTPHRCFHATLIAGSRRWNLTREAASKRRLIHSLLLRSTFWDRLIAALPAPAYVAYSYKDHADLYRLDLDDAARRMLHSASSLLPYPALAADLRAARITTLEWLVKR